MNNVDIYLSALYPTNLLFPNDWIIASDRVIDALSPELGSNYSFLIVFEETEQVEDMVKNNNLNSRHTTSVVSFFEAGIYQVESNLWSIVLTTGIIVVLLVYSIMSIEIQYHKPTIENLRGLGAKKRVIVGIFTMKSLMITITGGAMGIALGICVANGIVSVASLFGVNTIIIPLVDLRSIFLPLGLSMASGLIGGLIPSLKASKILKAGDSQ